MKTRKEAHRGWSSQILSLKMMWTFLLLFVISLASAQSFLVKGIVKDNQGLGLPGVSVRIQGENKGTLTDENGAYSLIVPSNKAVLLFTFMGMEPQRITVNNQHIINVTMSESAVALNEVVAIGYGRVKKSDVTGALSQVTEKVLQSKPVTNVLQAMQGQVSGVDISSNIKPGTVPSITVRGNRSLTASNSPLYVVDGIPLTAGSIGDIDPNDIASVEILKDASSTAIYGSRGANGVILITTKKGKKGTVSISYDGTVSFDNYHSLTKWMNAGQYLEANRIALMNAGQYGTEKYTNLDTPVQMGYPSPTIDIQKFALANDYYSQQNVLKGYSWVNNVIGGTVIMRNTTPQEQAMGWPAQVPQYNDANVQSYDWRAAALRQGITQNHQISLSAGTDNAHLYMSAAFLNQLGVQKDQNFNRYNMSINGDVTPVKWLTVGMSSYAALSIQNLGELNNSSNTGSKDLYSRACDQVPYMVPKDSLGNYIKNPGGNINIYNPLLDIAQAINQNRTEAANVSSFADVRFTPWLRYHLNFGAQFRENRYGAWTGSGYSGYLAAAKTATYNYSQNFSYVMENLLYFDKTFNKIHTLGATLMQSVQQSRAESSSLNAGSQIYDASMWYNIQANTLSTPPSYGTGFSQSQLMSYMGRVNYALMDRYLITATGRWDGASVLASGHQWSFFPSVAAAWKMQEEPFLRHVDWIRELKLRVGYGITGNAAVSPYTSSGPLSSNPYVFGSTPAMGYLPQQVPNSKLGWEQTAETDLGVDFSIFNDRISGSVDVYNENTSKLLMTKSLPPVTGFVSELENIGATNNRGIEINLTTVNLRTRNFTWTTNISWSTNKEKIVSLLNGKQDMLANRWFIGQPLQVYYDYKYVGIWQNTPADLAEMAKFNANGAKFHPGMIRVADLNGDYKIDGNDQKILGTNRPKWTGGITNTFGYKGFELSFFVYAKIGQMYYGGFPTYPGATTNMPTYILKDAWSWSNPSGKFPIMNIAEDPSYNQPQYAQAMAYNKGSFVVVRNISIAYSIPAKILTKYNIKKFQVFGQVLNPFIFGGDLVKRGINPDDNTGWDTASGTGMPIGGMNNNTILQQSFVCGVRASF